MNAAQTRALLAAALVSDLEERENVLDAVLAAFEAPRRISYDDSLVDAAAAWRFPLDRDPADLIRGNDLAAELHRALAGRLPCMEHVRRHPSDDPAVVAADVPTSDGHPTLCADCRASAYPMRLP